MKISNVRIYDIEETIEESGLPFGKTNYDLDRANRLAFNEIGSGEDCFLKGIIVRHRIQADHSFWQQWQRYHFQDIVSSESKMHCITKMEMVFHPFVTEEISGIFGDLIGAYNNDSASVVNDIGIIYGIPVKTKQDLFEAIIMNSPLGLELTASVITNFLQLKTIYSQRHKHKMSSWQQYCKWIEELPLQTLITVHK
jgi:hypothetical protein